MHKTSLQNLFALACGLIAALVVFVLMSVFMQNTVYRVLLTGNFPADTKIVVSNVDNSGNSAVIGHIDIKGSTENQYVGTEILNSPLAKLQLEFSSKPQAAGKHRFSLDSIQVPKPYSLD